jgi:hypothetical protein
MAPHSIPKVVAISAAAMPTSSGLTAHHQPAEHVIPDLVRAQQVSGSGRERRLLDGGVDLVRAIQQRAQEAEESHDADRDQPDLATDLLAEEPPHGAHRATYRIRGSAIA